MIRRMTPENVAVKVTAPSRSPGWVGVRGAATSKSLGWTVHWGQLDHTGVVIGGPPLATTGDIIGGPGPAAADHGVHL